MKKKKKKNFKKKVKGEFGSTLLLTEGVRPDGEYFSKKAFLAKLINQNLVPVNLEKLSGNLRKSRI